MSNTEPSNSTKTMNKQCLSTHGGAGYSIGSVVNKDGSVTCGLCGTVIVNPPKVRDDTSGRWLAPDWMKNNRKPIKEQL